MRIGYICAEAPGETDRLISAAVERLAGFGLRLAGAVQANPVRADRSRCDMVLRLLQDGREFRISADRGELARGCRLDAGTLEEAALQVEAGLGGADLLVVNKFGKQEATGRGFLTALTAALAQDMPVLCGVGRRNLAEFEAFSAGLAKRLPEDVEALVDWAMRAARAAA